MQSVILLFFLIGLALPTEVPMGCVTIKHVESGKYLAGDFKQKNNFRYIGGRENESEKEFWKVAKCDGDYTLFNTNISQFMMTEAVEIGGERAVYTVGADVHVHTKKWKIIPQGEHFCISNVKNPGCLFLGSFSNTYSKENCQDCKEDQYKWQLTSCEPVEEAS
uniref:Uncharacterized protein n=2 Tax=Culex quinquefasciatus TaxID=7176 RepID=A0A1S4KHD9_CULQU